jgi:hypothetical protein
MFKVGVFSVETLAEGITLLMDLDGRYRERGMSSASADAATVGNLRQLNLSLSAAAIAVAQRDTRFRLAVEKLPKSRAVLDDEETAA